MNRVVARGALHVGMEEVVAEVRWTDVDGVAVAWTEGRAPLTAGLLFRTGTVDEYLYTSGQTHLVEHLALSTVPDAFERRNGYVAGVVTGFVVKGSPEEVSAFTLGVCRALASLPGDRLEAEKQVLAVEDGNRRYNLTANLLTWRYGAVGWGLGGLPPLGYRAATLGQLQLLAAQRFTRGNAILWLSGPPPSDLRLELPEGDKLAVPALTPLLPAFPAWIVDDACGGVAVGATVGRVAAGTIFALLATRRLRDRLRGDLAVSYAPAVDYEPLDATTAHLVLYADSDAERRVELAEGFAEVLDDLGDIGEAEVDSARDEILENWTGSLAPSPEERALHDVHRAAMDWIFGREFESTQALADDLQKVSASEVAEFGRKVQSDALFALPTGAKLEGQMGGKAPPCLVPAVQGRHVLSIDPSPQTLVVGKDGVTALGANGWNCTVRYANLGAALTYEDGGVRLIGTDGASLFIEPTLWRGGAAVCDEIRQRVPGYLLLDQGARPADTIPKPTTRGQRLLARMRRVLVILGVSLGSLVVVLGVLATTNSENAAVVAFVLCLVTVIAGNAWWELSGSGHRHGRLRGQQ